MDKIMILGSTGMAGHMITKVLEKNGYNVINYARRPIFSNTKELNLRTIGNEIIREKPDLVINCVAILVQDSQNNVSEATRINGVFPVKLGETIRKYGGAYIHLSTDCVFSGNTSTFYDEESTPDPVSIYGVTKYLGEEAKANGLVIRTSIIGPEFPGRHHTGLFNFFMNSIGTVNGWNYAIWSGVTTYELAKYISYLIKTTQLPMYGLQHLVNNAGISKYNLLRMIAEVYDKDIEIIEIEKLERINRYMVCNNPPNDYKVPEYREMLIEMKDNYKDLISDDIIK